MNQNMRTNAFGAPMWFSLFMVAMGYPENPTKSDVIKYKRHVKSIGDVMPCSLCRKSFKEYTSANGDVPLTNDVFKDRKTFVYYLMKLKNRVNRKLGKPELSQSEMKNMYTYYNSFRAKSCSASSLGCTMAADQKITPMRTKIVTSVDRKAIKKN